MSRIISNNQIIMIKIMVISLLIGSVLASHATTNETLLDDWSDDELLNVIDNSLIRSYLPVQKKANSNLSSNPIIELPLPSKSTPDSIASDRFPSKSSSSLAKKEKQSLFLVILGIKGQLYDNAIAHLPVFRPSCYALQSDVQRFSQSLIKRIHASMRALGYYDSVITTKLSTMSGCWKLTVTIVKNRPIRIRNQSIKISVDHNDVIPDLLNRIRLKKPYATYEILNHKNYSTYKSKLSEAAQATGYLNYHFVTKQLRIDKKKYAADVVIHLATGKRFSFGEIIIEQDPSVLKGRYLERFIQLKKGQAYTAEALIKQQQLLQNSGYYKIVKVEARYRESHNNIVPITIKLTPKKRNAYKFKLGYGTNTGIHFKGEMDRRWLGSSGHHLNISSELSENVNQIQARLTVPKDNPQDNNVFYTVGWKRDSRGDVISNSYNIGAVSTAKYDNGWQRTLSIKYVNDHSFTVNGNSSKARLTLFGFKFAKIQGDDRLHPNNGWRLRLEAQGAMDGVLSDATVLQLRVHGKYIKQIGAGRLVARADIGTVLGDDIEELPKDLRFFAGGVNSVRGYSYNSLGDKNNNADVLGNRNLLTATLEYEYPINDEWGVAAFVDAGNAFDDWGDMDLQVGYGVGARWRSPIGPVRVDVAVPESDPNDVRIHLSIGPDL